jgi:RNA recognition motif-containing protein
MTIAAADFVPRASCSQFTRTQGGAVPQESTVVKLYVSNLPYAWQDDDLRGLFQRVGTVTEARVICDRDSGKSKGYGFVTLDTYPEPPGHWRRLQGVEVGGRTLTVDVARGKAS